MSGFTPEAQVYLLAYNWPGDVRELRNTVRRAVLLTADMIEPKHLRQALFPYSQISALADMTVPTCAQQQTYLLNDIVSEVTGQLETALIQHVLRASLQVGSLMKRRSINTGLFTSPKQAGSKWLCNRSTGLLCV